MALIEENTWNSVRIGSKTSGQSGYKMSSYEVSASWYNQQMVNTGDRLTRLQRYYDMDKTTVEISRALDIIAEDVSSNNADEEDSFYLDFPDEEKFLKSTINTLNAAKDLWAERTEMEDELFSRIRSTLMFGATFYHKRKDGSLKKLYPEKMAGYILDSEDEEKVTHYIYDEDLPRVYDRDKENQKGLMSKTKKRNLITYPVDELLILKMGDGPFGESVLEKVFATWRQMTLLEDAVIIYRVVRAPERRIYYIDVGNLQGPKREAAMERQRLKVMQKQANRQGNLTSEYDPHSTSEDIFIPTNSQGKGSRVETLQGGQNLGELSDLNYFQRKLSAGLRIPNSFIDTHNDRPEQHSDMRVGQVYQIEIRYLGYVKRIVRALLPAFNNHFREFCRRRDVAVPVSVTLDINPPMSFARYKDMEVQQTRLNIFSQTMQSESLSKRYAMQKYLFMDQEELLANEVEKLMEMGIGEEVIKTMPPEHVSNMVYAQQKNPDIMKEYGLNAEEAGGGGFGRF